MWKFLYSNKKSITSLVDRVRKITGSKVVLKSHYDVLGITPKATQSDIKAAYYKLSMQYHPDINKDEGAAASFRDITAAYEVLGNYKLRKLYDKGLLHTAGGEYAAQEHDNPEEKFYQSRRDRHQAPPTSGKTPIYDFDEWARAHYGQSFARRATARAKWQANIEKRADIKGDVQQEKVTLLVLLSFLLFTYVTYRFSNDYDVDRSKSKVTAQEKE